MGFFSALTGGITDLFSANEEKERGEDIFNAINRGREGISKAGKELTAFYEPFSTAAQPAYQKLYDLILGGDYSQYQESPGYKFAQDESMKEVMRSAAARGGVVSGQTLKALQERGKGLADQDFGTYLQRLSGLLGTSFSAGEAAKKLPIELAQQDMQLDVQGQDIMGQANIARTNKVGSGVGQFASNIDEGINMLASLFTGGMGGMSGGAPKGGFSAQTGVINPYSYGA